MKKYWIIAVIICAAIYMCGHSSLESTPEGQSAGTLERLDDLNSPKYRVGVPLGGKAMKIGEEQFSKSRICYFNNPSTAYEAILQRKADAFLFGSHALDFIDSRYPDLAVLPGVTERVDIAIAFSPEQGDLRYQVNRFISLCKADGTYDAMYKRWFKARRLPSMPYIEKPANPTRTIRVGTCTQVPPMSFIDRETQEPSGFDMELVQRLALHLNARIVVLDMDFHTLFEALDEGRIDMGIAGLNKDDKRPDQVIYSRNYIDSYIVAIVHRELLKNRKKAAK